jgi:hypothetical protein
MAFSITNSNAIAQSGELFFPETNHWIKEPFLSFYSNTLDAALVFGFPITDSYETSWTTVQYFQNVRLEIDSMGFVIISSLGDIFYEKDEGIPASHFRSSNTNCRMEDNWEYSVCFGFLDFYNKFGGEEIFGKPISGLEYNEDILVQNFYNSRFEWLPNLHTGNPVTIAELGSIFLSAIGENQNVETANIENNIDTIFDLNIWGIITKITASKGDNQTLNVVVRDQNNSPVEGVNIFVNIIYPKNSENPQQTTPIFTNSNGIAKINFQVLGVEIGKVQLIIVANYKNITQTTRSSFLIWY